MAHIRGIALASHLVKEKVAERMADRSLQLLDKKGHRAVIDVLHDDSAVQKGAALLLWAETDTGCILGADRAGKLGRRAESIADHAVKSLLEDIRSGAATDRFLADQLILFAALAEGRTRYLIPGPTGHVESNMWLVKRILGAKAELDGNLLTVDGVGFSRP